MPRTLPEEVKKATGNYRPSRHERKNEDPAAGQPFPEAPVWLPEAAQRVWAEVRETMEPLKLISAADTHTLARYCVLEAEFRAAPDDMPVAKINTTRQLANDLYMSPSMRAKIGSLQPKTDEENEFDGL